MTHFFETILNMSFTASIVILAVLLMRVFLKKAPRKFCYLLWLVVAFRLVVPFSFESSLSIFNLGGEMPVVEIPQAGTLEEVPEVSEELPEEEPSSPEVILPGNTETSTEVSSPVTQRPNEEISAGNPPATSRPVEETPSVSVPEVEEPDLPGWVGPGIIVPDHGEVSHPTQNNPGTEVSAPAVTPKPEVSAPVTETPVTPALPAEPSSENLIAVVATVIWLAGFAVMLVYSSVSYFKLKRRLSTAILLEGNVYGSDRIDAPFALGVFKPRIYIPFGLSDSAKEYVLAHERYHLKRLDHIVKPISFWILALHWFNPFCWIAFNRMSLDMELSCDEAVLAHYGNETMKKEYTKTLLDFATNKKFPSPAPLSFSEGASAKTRIKNALYWKKPKLWLSVVALVLSLVILVACAGNAITGGGEESTPEAETGLIDFGDTPYQFTFTSNGDGTCAITDILTDFHYKDHYDLVIPATSPDGDKVVEVDLNGMNTFEELIVPPYLLPETMAALADTIANSGVDGAVRASKIFKAFYLDSISHCKDADHATTHYNDSVYPDGLLPTESAQFKKREPYIQAEDVQRLATILKECTDYTEEQCYNDVLAVIEMLEKLEWESDEKLARFKREAVSFFYRSTRRIDKVVLPAADVKVHQGFLGLTYVLADGTAVTPVYENPVTLEIVTAEEPENVLTIDEDGNEVITFTSTRPVKDFHILTIDMADSITAEPHPKGDSTFHHKAFTATYKLLLGENIPTRGISFVGEDGETYQYAICYADGKKGSYKLVSLKELAGADFEEFSLLVKRVSDSTASKKTVYLSHPMMSDYDYFSITPNQPMTNVQIYFFQAEDEHATKGWWYEGAAASDVVVDPSALVVEFLPVAEGETIYVGAHSTTVTDTWGISFTDYQGNKRYFAVFPTLNGKRQVIEMELDQTRMQYLPNTCPELDYSMLEVVRTISSNLKILKDPRAEADQQFVLVLKKADGSYVEIHRADEYYFTYVCYNGDYVAFNNFERECSTEVYLYHPKTNLKTKLDLSALPEDHTASYMGWMSSSRLLFVSQLDHGTIVEGGELWCYDTNSKKIVRVATVSNPRLQITDFEIKEVDGAKCVQLNAVYFDETYNFTEKKTYYRETLGIDFIMNYDEIPCTLLPDNGLHIRPSVEVEVEKHDHKNVTPGASVTNNYTVISGTTFDKLYFCTFKAVKEDPAKGWQYIYACTGSKEHFLEHCPVFVQGSAAYSITDTWGFMVDGRFYAMMEDAFAGNDKLVDITDQIIGPDMPEDLSTLFDDTATRYEEHEEVEHNAFKVVHIYDWDQYFVLNLTTTLTVMGDTALGFSAVDNGVDMGVCRLEKGKSDVSFQKIECSLLVEPTWFYSAVTDKVGYLSVFDIDEYSTEREHYLAYLYKTTDGGLTWEEVKVTNPPSTGRGFEDPLMAKFLTEDFGVISFVRDWDCDLAEYTQYTNDGGKTWHNFDGLSRLSEWSTADMSVCDITLSEGVYTVTMVISIESATTYEKFTSTDLKKWTHIRKVVISAATDEQIADTENYTHFYDTEAYEKYGMYNAYILVQVPAPIESFCLEALTEKGAGYSREVLYETNLTPDQPVIIHTYINDVIPNRGYSYLNENGVRKYSELASDMKG